MDILRNSVSFSMRRPSVIPVSESRILPTRSPHMTQLTPSKRVSKKVSK
jgi:hypothetical protein